jgi:hypothetical protein
VPFFLWNFSIPASLGRLFYFLTQKNHLKMQKEAKVSERLSGESRTYFFDLREASNGTNYITVTQSYKNKGGDFQRDRLFVFEKDVVKFGETVQRMVEAFQAEQQPA